MPVCAAFNCSKRRDRRGDGGQPASTVTFHRFPLSKPDLVTQWVRAIRRDHFVPNKNSILCSDHFMEEDFDRTGQTVRLREGAVPSVFDLPSRLIKPTPKPRRPLQRSSPEAEPAPDPSPPAPAPAPGPSSSVLHDVQTVHAYAIHESPRTLKRKLQDAHDRLSTARKKLYTANRTNKRLKKKIESLSEVEDALREQNMTESSIEQISSMFSGVPKQVAVRMLSNDAIKGKLTREQFPPELRAFALTLHFYSARAYEFVRESFDSCLPHPSTIRKWYSRLDGECGFTAEVMNVLAQRVQESGDKPVLCSLMVDEMAIRKHVQWDGTRYRGYVDTGSGDDGAEASAIASEAIVYMLVALDDSWKVPCGYFLIDRLSGLERANILKMFLNKLHDVGVTVAAVVCDSPPSNVKMLKELGVNLESPATMTSTFSHPAGIGGRVAVILDACHMLKLIRNYLASGAEIKDQSGGIIKWSYIAELHKLQAAEGLRLGNKLRGAHIDWTKAKMKVNLAAQTLSSSVADAIEFCDRDLQLPQFAGSAATVCFIRVIDRLFDTLNSRNPCAMSRKAPLRASNQRFWEPFLEDARLYLIRLKDVHSGEPMHFTNKKAGFVGLLCDISSIRHLATMLVTGEKPLLNYLLTYKLSQDHLELFFGAVRQRGGWNNNPTSGQFMAAYKRLLVRHQTVRIERGNCAALDATTILQCSSRITSPTSLDATDMSSIRAGELDIEAETSPVDLDGSELLFTQLSAAVDNAVTYIAGYVVRMACRKIVCTDCRLALEASDAESVTGPQYKLLIRKNNGGLKKPSPSVVTVCSITEKVLRLATASAPDGMPRGPVINTIIAGGVVAKARERGAFATLDSHMLDTEPACENHVFRLIKVVAQCYLTVRLHHMAREKTEQNTGERVRKTLSKLILFRHQ